jgi:hypothetical protein
MRCDIYLYQVSTFVLKQTQSEITQGVRRLSAILKVRVQLCCKGTTLKLYLWSI